MSDNSFLKSYLRGEASYGFWNIVSRGVGAANTFITIGALTLYEYGSFQLLLASYAGAAVLLNIGGGVIRNDIIRFESEGRRADAKKLFYEIVMLRMITGILLWASVFFLAPALSFKYGPDFILLMRVMSFVFLHDALLTVITIPIEMRKAFSVVASRLSIAKFSQLFILLAAIVFYRVNLYIVVLSMTFSLFIGLIFMIQPFKDSIYPWKVIKMTKENFLFRILRSYGKWEVGEPILNRLTGFIETWAIKLFISTEAVAIFSIAQMLIATLTGLLPVKTLLTLIPMESENEEKLRRIYARGVRYISVLTLGMGLVSFFAIPLLIQVFFSKYTVSLPYFKALILTLPLHAVVGVSSVFLIALRRQGFLFFQKALKSFVMIPLYLLLLPVFGLWGLVAQNYIWLFVGIISISIYLKHTQPRLFIRFVDLIGFDQEDKTFLTNVFNDIKKYLSGRLNKIS